MTDDILNIFSCTDDNYARHLGVLMVSIRENNKSSHIRYWVVSNGISEQNLSKLRSIATEDFEVEIVDFQQNLEFLSSTIQKGANISLASYIRLFVADLVPRDLNRILYLDCDVICRGPIEEFFRIPMDGATVLGVRDFIGAENGYRLGVDRYINAGVLMIDLGRWRGQGVPSAIIKYLGDNIGSYQKLRFHDQDAINAVLAGNIHYVDSKWNSITGCGDLEYRNVLNTRAKNGLILHLIGKPWVKGKDNPFTPDYEKYLRMSPWSDEPLITTVKRTSFKWRTYLRLEKITDSFAGIPLLWRSSALICRMGYNNGETNMVLKEFDVTARHTQPKKRIMDVVQELAGIRNTLAMARMARAYLNGKGFEKDYRESYRWYKDTMDLGDTWLSDEFGKAFESFESSGQFTEGELSEMKKYIGISGMPKG